MNSIMPELEHVELDGLEVAVIGMSGRFPGANNISQFWENLRWGVESIRFYTELELEGLGVNLDAIRQPNFVRAGANLEEIDLFDAGFFGYSPSEAAVLDPQQRVFLECAWEALEDAGYDPEQYGGMIGIFAGASLSTYLLFNLFANPRFTPEDTFQLMTGNDKDFLSTRVSYELNLKGPAVTVQTACSTSLVAVHLACQSLLNYQTDLALAGGVSVQVPQRTGYYYQREGISSPDGHCRPFDARAQGTIFGSGAGIVVLKRLHAALSDGDSIYAVIKGSAINNDGSLKMGFTAPSLEAQAEVISRALAVAGVQPNSISYIEAHGTATPLGDPVEVGALNQVFGPGNQHRCALGSVKSNIGHLDAAAGIAGLIKTVLALNHRQLPPTLHFTSANPQIDFESGPFYVNNRLQEWIGPAGKALRAGVSSFGVGGTNAHLIVEEPPALKDPNESREWKLLMLSARSEHGLESATKRLCRAVQSNQAKNLADVSYTLQVGRRTFDYRRVALCRKSEDAESILSNLTPGYALTRYQQPGKRSVVFMFPGGGAQYVTMGLGLYRSERVFREQVDVCAQALQKHLHCDIRSYLYPDEKRLEEAAKQLQRTLFALPALFTIEYAVAQLWISWGIIPEAMVGHSLGEYTAACLAGVLSLEEALSLIVIRARLFEQLPSGAMLSVNLSEDELQPLIGEKLSLAAVNGLSLCVLSGSVDAIEEAESLLDRRQVEHRRVLINVAAHSYMVDQILEPFAEFAGRLQPRPPKIPYVSNLTGSWISPEQATDPAYWVRHLRETVRFGAGIRELLQDPRRVFLEVGPGQTLSMLAMAQDGVKSGRTVLASIRHPHDKQADDEFLARTLGQFWLNGITVNWRNYYADESRRRISLPTYPFERQRYWIDPASTTTAAAKLKQAGKNNNIDEWCYLQSWKRSPQPVRRTTSNGRAKARNWLIFVDQEGLGHTIAEHLRQSCTKVLEVYVGEQFKHDAEHVYTISPRSPGDYRTLLEELKDVECIPDAVLHLWSVTSEEDHAAPESFRAAQDLGFYSLLFLAQSFDSLKINSAMQWWVVANACEAVESSDIARPEKSTLLAACKVVPQEMENICCRFVDVKFNPSASSVDQRLMKQILEEIEAESPDPVVAYRGNQRWVQTYEPVNLSNDEHVVNDSPVYLITGAMGGIGQLLTEYLAQNTSAKLVLLAHHAFPPKDRWQSWLTDNGEHEISRHIRRLQELERSGTEFFVVSADVADQQQMQISVVQAETLLGRINGIIHAAGIAGERAVSLVTQTTSAECQSQFVAKVYGVYVLDEIFREHKLDFCLLMSSNAATLGGPGLIGYTAANQFMDSYAFNRSREGKTNWISVDWDGWRLPQAQTSSFSAGGERDQYAMEASEALEVFRRVILNPQLGHLIVSTGNLSTRLEMWVGSSLAGKQNNSPHESERELVSARSSSTTPYVPPRDELEQVIVKIWQEALGLDQLGIHDNFFDLGGNSLIGLKVIAQLKRQLDLDLPIVMLFEGPTVSALAQIISQQDTQAADFEKSRSRGESRRERRRLHLSQQIPRKHSAV